MLKRKQGCSQLKKEMLGWFTSKVHEKYPARLNGHLLCGKESHISPVQPEIGPADVRIQNFNHERLQAEKKTVQNLALHCMRKQHMRSKKQIEKGSKWHLIIYEHFCAGSRQRGCHNQN